MEINQSLSFYITVLYKDFLSFTEGELREIGLNFGQLPFILYIGKHPDCTPTDVKNRLQMDWGYAQRCIARLESDGFICKEKNKSNDRSYHLKLTDLGEQAFERSHTVFSNWDQMVKQALDMNEEKMLHSLFKKLIQQRKDDYRDGKI